MGNNAGSNRRRGARGIRNGGRGRAVPAAAAKAAAVTPAAKAGTASDPSTYRYGANAVGTLVQRRLRDHELFSAEEVKSGRDGKDWLVSFGFSRKAVSDMSEPGWRRQEGRIHTALVRSVNDELATRKVNASDYQISTSRSGAAIRIEVRFRKNIHKEKSRGR